MTQPIHLLIVDDHALFRESVARLLAQEPDLTIAGVCGTLREAKQTLATVSVDVVLLDYDLGDELGTDLIAPVVQDFPKVRVLLLSGGVSDAVLRRSAQAGIAGVVLKHCSPAQLLQAVRQIAGGGTWWDSQAPAALATPSPPAADLSERQTRILKLILEGLSNKEISTKLAISESAVKASIQELFRKTGVRTRSQLVRIAVESYAEATTLLGEVR